MVREIHKYFGYVKRQFSDKKLNFLILYVTSNCNFKCKTCFFHNRLHKNDDSNLEEFEKISDNLGSVSILLIAGGEPFLQPNLENICSIFIEKNKVDTLYIPTNGYLTERILSVAEALLKRFPHITSSINLSLDGMADYHEQLRGVEGSFNHAIETIEKLTLLKKKYNNLQVIVNSVIHHDNLGDLKKLAVYLRKFNLDYHAFEIMRGDFRDKNLISADMEEIKDMHEFILKNRQWYLARDLRSNSVFDFFNKIAVLGHLNYTQKLKEGALSGKKWPMKCAAGDSIAVVYPNGDVGLCELLGPVGNLKQYNYDLKQILSSPAAQKQRELIREKCNSCTHICFINASIASDWKTALKLLYFYLKVK